MELARHGITINCVEPGHVMTEGAAPQYDAAFKRAVESFIPMGRFAVPEDIARVVLFLASAAEEAFLRKLDKTALSECA